jgi:hypothetical protein
MEAAAQHETQLLESGASIILKAIKRSAWCTSVVDASVP